MWPAILPPPCSVIGLDQLHEYGLWMNAAVDSGSVVAEGCHSTTLFSEDLLWRFWMAHTPGYPASNKSIWWNDETTLINDSEWGHTSTFSNMNHFLKLEWHSFGSLSIA